MLHPTITPEFEAALRRVIDKTSGAARRVATFDGDNTLWDADIGEAFLRWLIAGGHLLGVDDIDVWAEYERRVAADRVVGYGWAVQVMQGLPEDRLQAWARQFSYAWPAWRDGMRSVVKLLEDSGVEVWIVSASGRLVVHEAAPYMGVSQDRVRGMEIEVADGLLTDRLKTPMTANAGKVEMIREAIGVRPIAAFGDSRGDLEMLEYAENAFVVGQRSRTNESFMNLARERGWPHQEF